MRSGDRLSRQLFSKAQLHQEDLVDARLEAEIQAAILKALRFVPYVDIQAYHPMRVKIGGAWKESMEHGHSDLAGVVHQEDGDGAAIYLEVKTRKGRPTPEQKDFLRRKASFGGYCAIVRNEDEALDHVARCRRGERTPFQLFL